MTFKSTLLAASLALCAATSQAATLFDITDALALSDPTQLGRLSRSGIPSDWSAAKVFPGIQNASTSYFYRTYSVNVGLGNFLQISVDWSDTSEFAAIYQDSYNPASLSTNYLGDIGASGNSFGNPGFFQVVAGLNTNVVIVISSAVSGGGTGSYDLLVENFTDTDFDDPPTNPAVPEPAGATLLSVGLIGAAWFAHRRVRR